MTRLHRYLAAGLVGAIAALAFLSPAMADPVRDAQWHLGFLNVSEAHRHSQGENVVVAVIDTGVDAVHPDLRGSVLEGVDLTTGGSGGDGRTDVDGHGTGMAGLIAADGRALGIAPRSKILPVRSGPGGLGFDNHIEVGLDWAIDRGARVVCIAAVSPDHTALRTAVERALAADIVVVAGVGNYPDATTVQFPAAYPGVIAAAGVDRRGEHAEISVTGPQVVLAAPAVDIVSTGLRGPGYTGYRTGTGASDATAIIAGAAALVRAKFPDLSAPEVVHRLTATADDRGPVGRDDEYGHGVVNLVRALTADVPPLDTASATPGGSGPSRGGGVSARTIIVLSALGLLALLCAGLVAATLNRRRTG